MRHPNSGAQLPKPVAFRSDPQDRKHARLPLVRVGHMDLIGAKVARKIDWRPSGREDGWSEFNVTNFTVLASGLALTIGTAAAQETQQSEQREDQACRLARSCLEPVRTEYGDWTSVCVTNDDGVEDCRLQQVLLNESGTAISILEVWKIADNQDVPAGAIIEVPLGIMLEDAF